ncbi:MAG: transporter substrate-binding domain-containing protein [Nitrosomonadales bacterium]|nr:transporter substrate-binding domain-containing protein [Nitrosomonadales bacterium]
MRGHTAPARTSGLRVLLSCLFLTLALEAHAQEATVVFDSTETPPIWSASIPGGGLGGELLSLLSKKAGVSYSMRYLPPARYSRSTSPFIVGNPNLLVNERNRAIFPIGHIHLTYFYYRPEHEPSPIRTLADLAGHRLGLLRGTVEDLEAFERLKVKVEQADSVTSLVRMLKKGRIDVAILTELPALHVIQQEFPGAQDDFVRLHVPGASQPIAVMVDLDAPGGRDIAKRYRQALLEYHRSPQYLEIQRKHHDHDPGGARTDSDLLERLLLLYESTWDE